MGRQNSRRRFLSIVGTATLGALAGCSTNSTRSEAASETRSAATPTPRPDPTATASESSSPTQTESTDSQEVEHDHQTSSAEFSDDTLSRARELGRTVQESVVRLSSENSAGTGWVVEDGYVLTNFHVTDSYESMSVETYDGRRGTATRIGYHEDLIPHIALMRVDVETPEPLPMNTDAGTAEGDPVVTVGHPSRVGDWVISLGRYDSSKFDWELADIPTSQGNSGSPILSLDGNVFGCISGTTTASDRTTRVDRSIEVYTEFPRQETLATSTPARIIDKWVQEWK